MVRTSNSRSSNRKRYTKKSIKHSRIDHSECCSILKRRLLLCRIFFKKCPCGSKKRHCIKRHKALLKRLFSSESRPRESTRRKNLPDNRSRRRKNLPDNRSRRRKNLPDNHSRSRKNLPDNRSRRRKNLPDNRSRSRKNLPDNRSRRRKNLPDNLSRKGDCLCTGGRARDLKSSRHCSCSPSSAKPSSTTMHPPGPRSGSQHNRTCPPSSTQHRRNESNGRVEDSTVKYILTLEFSPCKDMNTS